MRKIIFLPSDIYVTHDPPPGAALRFTKFQGPDGKPLYEYYSRGRLEDALDIGDEVWVVVEPRNLEQDFQGWWLSIVPKDHLVLINDLTSIDGYDTLDAMRSFARKVAPDIDGTALQSANTWMRILGLLIEKGFERGLSQSA